MEHIVLVVPAESYRADAFLQAAQRASQQLTVVTDAELPLGDQNLAVESMHPTPDELARIEELLFTRAPSIVLGVDEVSTRLAARLSDALGLTSERSAMVERAIDKATLREALALAEVNQPPFVVTTIAALKSQTRKEFETLVDSVGDDFIIKPTHETASRGVIRAHHNDLHQALDQLSRVQDPSAPVLLERYIEGPEFAIEGIVHGDQLEILMIFAKPDIGTGPYFWESTYIGPAHLTERERRELTSALERGIRALGLKDTPIHAELRLANERATILEIAPRSIGGRCSAALRFGDGQRLEDIILARALGDTRIARPLHETVGIYMIPTPREGILAGVTGLDAARRVGGIVGIEITVANGTHVFPPPFTDRYLGFIFAQDPGQSRVRQALARAASLLEIRIDPVH